MLAQIKTNFLFLLQNPEFCLSDADCRTLLSELTEDGSWQLDYEVADPNGWSWREHLDRVAALGANSNIVENTEYRNKIISALNFFLAEHRVNPNWWHNQIGLPRSAGMILLCLDQYLTAAQKEQLTLYVEQGSMACHESFFHWTGANLLWGVINTVMHGLIQNNVDLMKPALAAAEKELVLQENGKEGIQSDYSFLQHQTQFYSGGYGRSFTMDMANLVYALKETSLQFSSDALNVLGNFIIYGLRYCIRNDRLDYLTVGRELVRPNALQAEGIRKALLLLLKVPEMPCRDVMQEQLASIGAEGYALHGNKFFDQVNYYVSRSVTSHISCRGTSPLRSMGESINGENHLSANEYAGGATCIMMDGKEYDNIFPVWDFAHVPGTTAPEEADEEIEAKLPHWHGTIGKNAYCGGISHNRFGIMYQDLNFDGVTGVTSRFFIDGMMIALGADLTCTKEKPLTTTLNQCWQYDDILSAADGLPSGSVYQGRVAYASLDGQQIQIRSEQKAGSFSRINRLNHETTNGTVCTFYIDHGVQPNGVSYAYTVIPSVAASSAADQIQNITKRITVLRNDAQVQAIRYENTVFCVFHQSGCFRLSPYDQFISSAPTAHIINLEK